MSDFSERAGVNLMPLFPYLAYDEIETHLSFASRLAAFHTGGRLVPFLNDLRIPALDFAMGKSNTVARLAERAGISQDRIVWNTPISAGKATYQLRGENISSDFLANPATVFCPDCLQCDDDMGGERASARRGRFIWLLKVVRTCPRHKRALVERPRQKWDDQFHEMSLRVPEHGAALSRLAENPTWRDESPLQRYALARLDGVVGPAWLEQQTIEQAVRSTEMLGALLEFGSGQKVSNLSSDDWDQAGATGFAYTSRGEAGIREALCEVQSEFEKSGRRPLNRNVFGRFYEWLAASKTAREPGDIKRILREYMFDTVELGEDESLLGQCIPARRLHSVASLARESSVNPTTLRNVLIAQDLIKREGSNQVFDAKTGRAVAASIQAMVHVISLPKMLNCSRPQASGLIDEQILMPIVMGAAGSPGRTQKGIDAKNVSMLLSEISDLACVVKVIPAGMVPISKAAEKAKVPGTEMFHLLLGGYLSNVVSIATATGIGAVHVDASEVRRIYDNVMFGLSPSMAAARLRLPTRTIWSLLENQESEPQLPCTVVVGQNGRYEFHRIMPEAIDDFQKKYTHLVEIANSMQVERKVVVQQLAARRILPHLRALDFGVDFYLVDDVTAGLSLGSFKAAA